MRKVITGLITVLLFVALSCVNISIGGDLDDGISKYTDDGIIKADQIEKVEPNIKFIIVKSLAKGKTDDADEVNENSIVIEPGAKVGGDIINIVTDKPKKKSSE